jgi:ribosome biogenesis protein MAK21
MAGSNAADLLVKPSREGGVRGEVNSEVFWQKKVEDVAADEVFFHSYFNQAGNKRRNILEKKSKKVEAEHDESDEDGEEEIWKAITASKPEVEGPDEDDDLSMGDLESAYSSSGDGSEAGIDLGGDDNVADEAPEGEDLLANEISDAEDMDDMPDFESEDDALLGDEDDLPEGLEVPEEEPEEEMSKNKKKRKERKKLKQLPTFASAEDYAKLLGDDDDEGM